MFTQLFINGIVDAGLYSIVGLGVGIVYWESRFFNFACASIISVAGYFVWLFVSKTNLPLVLAIPVGICSTILLNITLDALIYAPMKKKAASTLVLLLASFGIYVVLQNVISLNFGDSTKIIRSKDGWQSIAVVGARITSVQFCNLISTILLLGVTGIYLSTTRMGLTIRAVASNPTLATLCGVDRKIVTLVTVVLSSLLLGSAGVMISLDTDLTPTIGLTPLMMGIVVIFMAGKLSVVGIVGSAILLALLQQLSVWQFGGNWEDAIAFAILLMFLLLRPAGFMGKKVRKSTV